MTATQTKTPGLGEGRASRNANLSGTHYSIVDRLAKAILSATGARPDIIADSLVHRFDHPEKARGNRRCWYACHPGHAVHGDWGTGDHEAVFPDSQPDPLKAEQARQQAEKVRRKAEAERLESQAQASTQARQEWASASPANPEHRYLRVKGIDSAGLRQIGVRLIVPMTDGRSIVNLQSIYPNGDKRFMTGARKKGCYFALGAIKAGEPLLICEGVATGITLHAATGYAVACAMDCGNLLPVAQSLRARYPSTPIIVAADNDHCTEGNPGVTAGKGAAAAVGGRCVWPEVPKGCEGTDFNDLAQIGGEVDL